MDFLGRESISCVERGLNEYLYTNEGEKCSRIWSQKFMFAYAFRRILRFNSNTCEKIGMVIVKSLVSSMGLHA